MTIETILCSIVLPIVLALITTLITSLVAYKGELSKLKKQFELTEKQKKLEKRFELLGELYSLASISLGSIDLMCGGIDVLPKDEKELYFYKRKSFQYEHEVRAVIHDFKRKDASGIEKEVDINKLVANVYLSPYSPDWYKEIVEELVVRFGYKIMVHKSGMSQEPF